MAYLFIVGTSIDVNNWVWYIAGILLQAECSKLSEKWDIK